MFSSLIFIGMVSSLLPATLSHQCTGEHGIEPNIEDEGCESYWECSNNVGVLKHCNGSDQFDFEIKECRPNSEVWCQWQHLQIEEARERKAQELNGGSQSMPRLNKKVTHTHIFHYDGPPVDIHEDKTQPSYDYDYNAEKAIPNHNDDIKSSYDYEYNTKQTIPDHKDDTQTSNDYEYNAEKIIPDHKDNARSSYDYEYSAEKTIPDNIDNARSSYDYEYNAEKAVRDQKDYTQSSYDYEYTKWKKNPSYDTRDSHVTSTDTKTSTIPEYSYEYYYTDDDSSGIDKWTYICASQYGHEPDFDDKECKSFWRCDLYKGSKINCKSGHLYDYRAKACRAGSHVHCSSQMDFYKSEKNRHVTRIEKDPHSGALVVHHFYHGDKGSELFDFEQDNRAQAKRSSSQY